ncbi:hypothetical protein PHMEG_00031122 [Phytophthora megakarya]|uniref:Transposase n=1 Tax=Phytophthora megakarya TaxID=4795 RepID=A0A225V016_9STRA|nr:hypothetical protein PHMEG_00031122 [Phytophthora megakarya]
MGYTHERVNHSRNFVNPENGAHTQRIVWEVRLKQRLKSFRGYPKHLTPSYIDEWLWRTWFFPPRASPQQFFKGLVDGIKRHYN